MSTDLRKPKENSASTGNFIDRADQELVSRAYRKTINRESLTRDEQRALKHHERVKEERLRWQFYGSIPQKHWVQMSGRHARLIAKHAAKYNLPCGGKEISLPAMVRAFHDLLVDNAVKLDQTEEDLLRASEPASPALERYREERATLARLDRMEREGVLLPRDEVRQNLDLIASILRSCGDTLQRQFGPSALEILHEALDEAEREIDRAFGGTGKTLAEIEADAQHAAPTSPDPA